VPRVQNINDGINAVRRMLATSLIDPARCERGLKCLRNYRKEWDEDRATFRDRPFHNWASHGADSLRNFAQGFVEPAIVVRNPRQSGHRFRRKAAIDSDRKRPPNPNEGGHPVDRVRRGALSAI
jgi:hypothetical protein